MLPLFNRNFAFLGAPVMGFGFGAPRMGFEPTMRPMFFGSSFGPRPFCTPYGNPFGSFMGGVVGGLMGGLLGGCLSNSFVPFPQTTYSAFPFGYSSGYSSAPVGGFNFSGGFGFSGGFDSTDMALNGVVENFMKSFSLNGNTTAPTTAWSSMPFNSLTQNSYQRNTTSTTTPPRTQTTTTASQPRNNTADTTPANTRLPAAGQQPNGTISTPAVPVAVNQTVSTTAPAAGQPANAVAAESGSANTILLMGDTSKAVPSVVESSKGLRVAGLVPLKQRYDEIMNKLNQTSQPTLENIDLTLHNDVTTYQQMALSAMDEIEKRGSEPNAGEIDSINTSLDSLAVVVKKYQDFYSKEIAQPKDAATIKAEEDTFNAVCTGGSDCGDSTDRLYYNKEKGEWQKSTKKGYSKIIEAPASTLEEVPELYRFDQSGIKYSLNKEALKHFIEMSDVAFAERGIELTVKSGFRSYKDQEREFTEDKEKMRNGQALPNAAPPGYTEHSTGFAFDVADSAPRQFRTDDDFAVDKNGEFVLDKKTGKRIPIAPHYRWMEKNAKKFGFELSYPVGNKEDVKVESWHWRFNPKLLEKYGAEGTKLVEKYKATPAEMSEDTEE